MSSERDGITLSFRALKMQSRFLDRAFADTLSPVLRRFFMRVGGAVRLTARRSLKKAPQKKAGELSEIERSNYDTALKLFKSGRNPEKPRRPDRTAEKGKPPFLHSTADNGTSPLKYRLWFALSEDKRDVIIGPAAIGKNRRNVLRGGMSSLRDLEREHPFMEPAYRIIEPRIPEYLRAAT